MKPIRNLLLIIVQIKKKTEYSFARKMSNSSRKIMANSLKSCYGHYVGMLSIEVCSKFIIFNHFTHEFKISPICHELNQFLSGSLNNVFKKPEMKAAI